MERQASSVDGMGWAAYVKRASGGEINQQIAEAIGVTASSVSRWRTGKSSPDHRQAAAFARAYGRPVLEAFIAAGFLTAAEAGQQPSAPPNLGTLDDDALIAEVARRIKRGGSDDAGHLDDVSDRVDALLGLDPGKDSGKDRRQMP